MQLSDLQKAGGFVDTRLIKKTADWKRFDEQADDEITSEVGFFVRRAGYLEVKRAAPSEGSGLDPDALMIASCIRLGKGGDEVIPYAGVRRQEPGVYRSCMGVSGGVYGRPPQGPGRGPGPR